ncbi:GtrA-like protein [mine drainage metagenome]|uniref:GtrA-like protein n=1 Tax=mine drainage metagenome TaxID=410659 RepID=A0A1J5PQ55_9ZZZZ
MTTRGLVLRYAAFAVVATLVNLGVQRLVLAGMSGAVGLAAAMFIGTVAGLAVKYVLDKNWIFYDISTGAKAHGRKFILYSAMGVVTTLVFWGSETSFWLIWHTAEMREIGAALGLGVGYLVKYNLDRRFVFTDVQLGLRAAS